MEMKNISRPLNGNEEICEPYNEVELKMHVHCMVF
jgi:hypothetical protein